VAAYPILFKKWAELIPMPSEQNAPLVKKSMNITVKINDVFFSLEHSGHVQIFSMHYIAILPNLLRINEVKIIPEVWKGVI
jgi:hypothetical protein